MSVLGATVGAVAIIGGVGYHSQHEKVDGYRRSIDSLQDKILQDINSAMGCNDFEIRKRALELGRKSVQFSETTQRLVNDKSATFLLPKNAEALRVQMEKGVELKKEGVELVLDGWETMTNELAPKLGEKSQLMDTAVSPGSPLEQITCDESLVGLLLAKLAKKIFSFLKNALLNL